MGQQQLKQDDVVGPCTSPTVPDPAWGCRLSPTGNPAAVQLTELLPSTQSPLSLCPHGTRAGPSGLPCPPAPAPSTAVSFPCTTASILAQQQRQHEPYANQGQLPHSVHAGSDIWTRSPKSPAFAGPSPPACRRQRPEPAGLMRSAWDLHLVAIERGAALGREEAQISCSTKEGRGMSVAERRPRRPPSLHQLSRDDFSRDAKAPDHAVLLCRHCWSSCLGMCSTLPWAEPFVCPAAPPFFLQGCTGTPQPLCTAHGHAGPPDLTHGLSPPDWCCSGSRSRPCCSGSGVKTTLPTPPGFNCPSKQPWEESRSPSKAVKVARSKQGLP